MDIHLFAEVAPNMTFSELEDRVVARLADGDKPGVMRELRNFRESQGKSGDLWNHINVVQREKLGLHRGFFENYPIWDARYSPLFRLLGGMKEDRYPEIPALSQYRGLPDDVSGFVKYEHDVWGDNALGTSWLTVYEIFANDHLFHEHLEEGTAKGFLENIALLSKMHDSPTKVRIVFWFDC
jgi:hypothetical protein